MANQGDRTSDSSVSVEVSPSEVDAATDVTIRCRVTLPSEVDHRRAAISIRDQDNAELAFAPLTQLDGDHCITDEIRITAPAKTGEHIWRAVLLWTADGDSAPHVGSATDFTIAVKAHIAKLSVWDLPPAITIGERFTLKAGIKCSAGCNLAGSELGIFDADGTQLGTGTLRDDVWPGTSALYFADMDVTAPVTVGDHTWEVRVPASHSGVPHASGAHAFTVKAVNVADCEVTIEAFDAEKQRPISGARIVMHPYRAVTGADGTAKIRLVKGTYKLLVGATRYFATAQTVDVTEDVTLRTELAFEPAEDSASFYV